MSRVAKQPVPIPSGVTVDVAEDCIRVKGSKGELSLRLHPLVRVHKSEDQLLFQTADDREAAGWVQAGTARALTSNMVLGVASGFEKRLLLTGVGYRGQVQGSKLTLNVGYSHQVEYQIPEGIKAEMPSPTEIVITGIDKQKVGQVAAEIRRVRPPEPYKGKGISYSSEKVRRKVAKKK